MSAWAQPAGPCDPERAAEVLDAVRRGRNALICVKGAPQGFTPAELEAMPFAQYRELRMSGQIDTTVG